MTLTSARLAPDHLFNLLLCGVLFAMAGAAQAKDPINDDNLKKIAKNEVKRIVIPSFQVIFQTKASAKAQSKRGLFSSNNAKSTAAMFVEWKDADPALLQQIADNAYSKLEKQLTEAGFEVVARDKVIQSASYAKLNGSSAMVKDDKMIQVAPTGMKVYDPMGKIDPNGSFFLGVANLNSALEGAIANEAGGLEKVGVMRATVNVIYGNFETEGNTVYWDNDTASAKVGFNPLLTITTSSPTVTPMVSGMTIFSNYSEQKLGVSTSAFIPKDTTTLSLQEIMISDKPVSHLTETTTTGEAAATGVANVLGVLMGGGGIEVGKYDVTVEPEAFASAADEQIGRFWQMLAGKLKSGG